MSAPGPAAGKVPSGQRRLAAAPSLRYLNERVTREIGLRILDGTYRPGDTIPSEMTLCAELGVSRTALREAIKFLFSKGLVTPRVKVGTIVNPRRQWNFFDPTVLEWLLAVGDIGPFLVELWALRKALEPAAAALAARNAAFEDFEALHHSFAAMAAAADVWTPGWPRIFASIRRSMPPPTTSSSGRWGCCWSPHLP